MADVIVSGTKWDESQFQGVPLKHALCGPNALAMAESWGGQSYVNTLDVFNRMYAASPRRCDSEGASTIDELEAQAQADGFKTEKIGYTDAGIAEATWRHFLAVHAGKAVVIVETLAGQQLRDLISGQGEDATNLERHFFGIYGLNDGSSASATFGGRSVPAGYITSDGCNNLMNPVVNGARTRVLKGNQQLYYPYTVVRAARPAAMLAVYARAATTGETPQQTIIRQWQDIKALRTQIYAQNTQLATQSQQIAQLQAMVAAVRKLVNG